MGQLTNQLQSVDQALPLHLLLPDDQPQSVPNLASTDPPVLQSQVPSTSGTGAESHETQTCDTDEEPTDQPQVACLVEEGEVLDQDQDTTTADLDQALSGEQTYREILRGIRSFMDWRNIPDIDISASIAGGNPFTRPKVQPVGKVLVNKRVDDWLCKKMDKLTVTLEDGYPSCSFEASDLLKDQFAKPVRS